MVNAMLKTEPFEDRRDDQLGYAGDISPQECWDLLASEKAAALIDVRTQAEWAFVGTPNLSSLSKQLVGISWKIYPTMEVNSQFIAQLQEAVPDMSAPVAFICKTGGRSLDAAVAATQAGYTHAYNVANGFDGDQNEHGQRGMNNGWKATGLAWEQQ